MPPPRDRDRDLLFGVLALQVNFIGREALAAGLRAALDADSKPLGQILQEQGQLTPPQRRGLEGLIEAHLAAYGGDARRSLESLSSVSSVRSWLEEGDEATHTADGGSSNATLSMPVTARDGARYRIVRLHAKGGLGQVFVAHDTELHREVALKEIQPNRADDAASRARFVLEAEVTGGLEHPGIVPVYGLGAYADGRPYYAMRFIRGDSLKEAIDRFHGPEGGGRLKFRALLRRFGDVCNAVAYAHSRGVLHRDIKPSNVMLGKFGETLLVDWGLAKVGIGKSAPLPTRDDEATLRPSSGSDADTTRAGSVLGTPQYMSPEQAGGRLHDLGPTTDVYSLGATLYVLLTGEKPFHDAPNAEVLARVQIGKFFPPRQVRPTAPRALEAVCLKAMAKRPEDRYPSALDLAADIDHWLADEPVSAYREPLPARAARWARRHRTAVAAAGVLLLSAVVALSATTLLVLREQRATAKEKVRAEESLALSHELSVNSTNLIIEAESEFAAVPALDLARQQVLTTAARNFRRELEADRSDPQKRQRAAVVYRYLANVHRLRNDTGSAEPLYRESIELHQGLAEEFADQFDHHDRLSGTLRDYATLKARLGRLGEADELFQRSVSVVDQLRNSARSQSAYQRLIATTMLDRATILSARGRLPEARRGAGEAAGLFRKLLAAPARERHPYDPLFLAAALNHQATATRDEGQPDLAAPLHAEAVKVINDMLANPPPGVNRADLLNTMAMCQLEKSMTQVRGPATRPTTLTNLGRTIDQWHNLAQAYPKVPVYRETHARALLLRGQVQAEVGQPAEAQKDFDSAREILEALVTEFPILPDIRADLGRAYAGLGRSVRTEMNPQGGDEWFAKAGEQLDRAIELSPDNAEYKSWRDAMRGKKAP